MFFLFVIHLKFLVVPIRSRKINYYVKCKTQLKAAGKTEDVQTLDSGATFDSVAVSNFSKTAVHILVKLPES